MSERLLTVKKAENGFVVESMDRKIMEENEKGDEYNDPEREYVLKTADEVVKLVTTLVKDAGEVMSDKEIFDDAFKEASTKSKD